MLRWATKKKEPEISSTAENQTEVLGGQAEHQPLQRAASEAGPLQESHTSVSSLNQARPIEKQAELQAVSPFVSPSAQDSSNVAAVSASLTEPAEEDSARDNDAMLPLSSPRLLKSPVSSSPVVVATSWSEALYRACEANQTFSRTPAQVLQEQQQVLRPRVDSVIIYQENVEMMAKAVVEELNKNLVNNATSASTSKGLAQRLVSSVAWGASSAMWVGSKVIQTVIGDEDDYDEEELTYKEQADDGNESIEQVGWTVSVVCVDFVGNVVNQLLSNCDRGLTLRRQGTDEYSFAGWVASTCTLCKNIEMPDLDLLANVLVSAGHAVFYEDYIVFDASATQTELQVAAALGQLKQAIQDTDNRIEEWTRQADNYTRAALRKKQRGDQKGALHELQKAKLLSNKIEGARSSLLNLHQTHDTLETSSLHHAHVLKPLEATASALKALREECPLDRVDEIALDLQEDLEAVTMMTAEPQYVGQDYDEVGDNELLEELSKLSVEDDGNEREEKDRSSSVKPLPRISEPKEKSDAISPVKVSSNAVTQKPRSQQDEVATPSW